MPDFTYPLNGGLNLVDTSTKTDNADFRKLQNFISRHKQVEAFPGSQRYNTTALSKPPTWATRYYGITASGERVKKAFCFSDGAIYAGNDVTGALTSVQSGFSTKNPQPDSITLQVGDRSRLYFFSGNDIPYYHDGDAGNTWYKSGMLKSDGTSYKPVQGEEHLQRLFTFEANSSDLLYSKTADYENLTDSSDAGLIVIRKIEDSVIRRVVLLGDYLFIFKSDSIHVLEGRTPTTFRMTMITDKFGLAGKNAIYKVGTAYVFVNSHDNEVYSFGGTEQSIKLMSRKLGFAKILNHTKTDRICMTEHDNLCRISFWHREQLPGNMYNSFEAVFPTDEMGQEGPKWCLSKGANISCYSRWDEQGEDTLVTGRSDVGCLMYHYRGHNWDTTPMEYQMRLADSVADEGMNVRVDDIWIDGDPQQTKECFLRLYLDARFEDSIYSDQEVSMDTETRQIAVMSFPITNMFKTWIKPLSAYSKGNSVAPEIYGKVDELNLVIRSIKIRYHIVDKVRSYLVGG